MTGNTQQDRIQQALEKLLHAADGINNPAGNGPPETPETLEAHNNAMQGLVLQAWEELAVLTGNRDLAERNCFETIGPEPPTGGGLPSAAAWLSLQNSQPIVPFHQLDDPLRAMGAAMFHAGAAALQYAIVQDSPSPGSGECSNAERYCRAENDARIAHAVLHRTHTRLAPGHPFGPEIRKYCRQANLWLTRERSRAARVLGIHPPPEASDDLQHGELDHDGREATP